MSPDPVALADWRRALDECESWLHGLEAMAPDDLDIALPAPPTHPLPPELAARAEQLLDAVGRAEERTRRQREELANSLEVLGNVGPEPPDGPSFLDVQA